VTLLLWPAKRPPSAPGSITPVSKEPSSAVSVCGLPPTLATTSDVPEGTVSRAGSKRRRSPVKPGSTACTRAALAVVAAGRTISTPFIFAGLTWQK
jgi:hypothetical protein